MASIINTYASAYKWDRNQILNIPLDEHFFLMKEIERNKREDYFMKGKIALLPNVKDQKTIDEFFNSLRDNEDSLNHTEETSIDELDKIKKEFGMT